MASLVMEWEQPALCPLVTRQVAQLARPLALLLLLTNPMCLTVSHFTEAWDVSCRNKIEITSMSSSMVRNKRNSFFPGDQILPQEGWVLSWFTIRDW